MIELRVIPTQTPWPGYRAETAPEYQILGAWLQDEVQEGGDDYDIEALWRDIGARTRGEREPVALMSNAMAVRVDRTVRLECRWGALELSLFTFAETTERWFAVVAPAIAVELRRIRATWAAHDHAGPATPAGAAVLRMIDALLAITAPRAEAVGRALGVELQPVEPTAMWTRFAASLASGPIATVTLSSRNDTGAASVRLDARGRTNREELDLDRFGPRPVPENNPVAPEGVLTYSYDLHGKTLAIQVTAVTHTFVFASIHWPGRRA